jgi:hypothetical protein
MSLGDGRSLCMECLDSAVMDTGECQPLYHSIRDYYEGMNMKLDQQIPMLLVERQALNEAMEGECRVSSNSVNHRCVFDTQSLQILMIMSTSAGSSPHAWNKRPVSLGGADSDQCKYNLST